MGLLGPFNLSRAYYYCGRCGKGSFPFDEQARLSPRKLTPAAEEIVCQAGVLTGGFAEAAEKVLPKQAGLHISESTIERVTEDAGARLGDWLEQGITLGEQVQWTWHKDNKGRRVGYLSVDATGVQQQGPNASKADGRMPYVAMVYNPPPEKLKSSQQEPPAQDLPANRSSQASRFDAAAPTPKPPKKMQARYLAGLYTLPLLGLMLRKQAAQVGMEAADLWIGLSDGGSGLENFLQSNFNRHDLVVILDFHHPAGRLEELAKAWQEADAEQAKLQAQQWCKTLKHEGGQALLTQIQAIPPPKRKAVRQKYEEMLGYLENHKHKMNYPEYQKNGWYIGSGAVESACKTVVGQRLKLAGMRWGEFGTDNVCHLRALFKSEKGQWEAFWDRILDKRSIFHQPM